MSKNKKILLAILLIILIALFFLPTLIKNYTIKNSKELVGRKIDIGTLKYNYFSSTVKVYDFKMFEQNDTDHFTTFDTLIINLEPLQLLKDKIEIEQFYIKGLMVKTVMQDSTFNFDDLIAFHATPNDSLNNDDTDPLKYSISEIELKDAHFIFDNQNVGKITDINDFSFFIPHIGWDQEHKSSADLKFNLVNGGFIETSLNINPVDGEFDALIKIDKLFLNPFYEYVKEYAEINSFDGQLNAEIKIEGNTNDAVKSIVSGTADVENFTMTDTNDKEVLASKHIHSALQNIDYHNSSYTFESLNFTQPYIYFEMDSITNNMYKLFKMDPEGNFTYEETQTESDSLDDSSDLYYAINNLIVNDGVLDYSDNLTGERFDYHLSDIKMNSKDIVSDATWVDIYADMILNNRGTLKSKLGYNPSDLNNLNLDLTIENFLLSDINIYSQYYTGHSILLGDFYYYSKSEITNGEIVSENNLLVKNVEVENDKNGLFSLPLKFALWILKDKNGDVNLEIPVRGDLNDPELSIGKIVWTTFKKRITGAASNPVNSLATLVDVDPKDYQEFTFEYMDTIPNESQFLKLDKLLEMETKKEGLKIELIHFVDPELQHEAIVFSELGKQYFKDTEKDYKEDEKGFESYLRIKVSNDSINKKDAAFQLIKPQTTDSLANIYNEKLIKNTIGYLKTTENSTNISVIKADLKEPDNIGSLSRFKIKYDMLDEQNIQNDTINSTN
jgi:hypothetical protein